MWDFNVHNQSYFWILIEWGIEWRTFAVLLHLVPSQNNVNR